RDELIRHGPLTAAIVCPDRTIAPVRPRSQQSAEEEMQALCGFPEWIAFDVEDHVSTGGRRQELKAAALVARDRMPIQSSGRTPFDLECRLITQGLEGMPRDPRNVGFRSGPSERRHRRQTRVAQSHDLLTA